MKVGFFFLLVCAVAGMGYAEEIVSIFRKGDPAVVATGAAALRWQFITYPLGAWIVVSNMMLQTIRKPVRATILSSARQGLFFIPLIFILPYFLGLKGVEMCQAASDMLTFFLAIPLTCGVLWDCCSLHRFPLLWGRRLLFFRIRSAIWESFCWVLLL